MTSSVFLRNLFFALLIALQSLMWGCASGQSFTFVSAEPGSQLSLVPLDSPDSEGIRQKNPTKIESAEMKSNALRISASGKASQYWFAVQPGGTEVQVRVKGLPTCDTAEGNRNRPIRLLLKSYQALYTKNYRLARELASRAAVLDPSLAAPHIISGLAYLREGNRKQANSSFSQAQSLDPEDAEIGQLMRATQ